MFAPLTPSALRSPAPGLAIGASLGSIPGRNLVGLAPQSKPFFSHLECEGLMAEPVLTGLAEYPKDRVLAAAAQAPRRQKPHWRRSIANIANRVRCASSISGPAQVRCYWRCSRSCRARSASAPISASPRCVVPTTTPPRSACPPARRSWRATTGQLFGNRSISSFQIRLTSRGRTLRGCKPRCATSIRDAHSTAGPTASMAIVPSRPMRRACWHPTASWCSNSDRVSSAPRPRSSPERGSHQLRHGTILRASPGPLFYGRCHEGSTFLVRKKALGLWVKTD